MIKIEITAEDYFVATSLYDLGNMIEETDILDEAYNNGNGIEFKKDKYSVKISKL